MLCGSVYPRQFLLLRRHRALKQQVVLQIRSELQSGVLLSSRLHNGWLEPVVSASEALSKLQLELHSHTAVLCSEPSAEVSWHGFAIQLCSLGFL